MTRCAHGAQPAALGEPREPPYLPAQVAEADVELVLLAGLPLVSAAVLCRGQAGEGQEHTSASSAHAVVSAAVGLL